MAEPRKQHQAVDIGDMAQLVSSNIADVMRNTVAMRQFELNFDEWLKSIPADQKIARKQECIKQMKNAQGALESLLQRIHTSTWD